MIKLIYQEDHIKNNKGGYDEKLKKTSDYCFSRDNDY